MKAPSVLVVEDNPLHQEHIYLCLIESDIEIVGIESHPKNVLPTILRTRPDVVLMDIDLGNGDEGIALAEEINQIKPTPIVFTTGKTDKATLSRAVSERPVSYLVKPISKENLLSAIELAIFKNKTAPNVEDSVSKSYQQNTEAIFIKSGHKLIKLVYQEIQALVVQKDRYLRLVTENEDYLIRSSLVKIQEKLPNYFVQCHRSNLINMHRIESIDEFEEVVMVAGKAYNLGRRHKPKLLELIKML